MRAAAGTPAPSRPPCYADFRRVRDHNMADLAAVFGVRPWETDDLTFADLLHLAQRLDAMREAAHG